MIVRKDGVGIGDGREQHQVWHGKDTDYQAVPRVEARKARQGVIGEGNKPLLPFRFTQTPQHKLLKITPAEANHLT